MPISTYVCKAFRNASSEAASRWCTCPRSVSVLAKACKRECKVATSPKTACCPVPKPSTPRRSKMNRKAARTSQYDSMIGHTKEQRKVECEFMALWSPDNFVLCSGSTVIVDLSPPVMATTPSAAISSKAASKFCCSAEFVSCTSPQSERSGPPAGVSGVFSWPGAGSRGRPAAPENTNSYFSNLLKKRTSCMSSSRRTSWSWGRTWMNRCNTAAMMDW
mmetsp:Transcript_115595/g.333966  ORF Transcript_115595/g.333966 Transcript_115595/m.333966 type:complete len:219 (-) Transcript_115595:1008-1664(-)